MNAPPAMTPGTTTSLREYISKVSVNIKVIISSLLLSFIIISCAKDQDIFQLVHTGQTKQEIKDILGEPKEIKVTEKLKGPIWGPEEEFWDKITDGSKLEVWSFENDAGNLNLYFIENNNHLDYKAFAPKGVVYESIY